MSENIDQFAIYSAKIFQLLYDSFPIPKSINPNEVTAEYLTFELNDELDNLKLKLDIANIAEYIVDDEPKLKEQTKLPAIKDQIMTLEEEKLTDKNKQKAIYDGTLEFLTSEGLLRKYDNGGYQLTSKGFSHLNKTFKDGNITDDKNKTNISVLKTIFDKTSDTSFQVAAGTAVNVITKILGYS